jgi:hypothetical protein
VTLRTSNRQDLGLTALRGVVVRTEKEAVPVTSGSSDIWAQAFGAQTFRDKAFWLRCHYSDNDRYFPVSDLDPPPSLYPLQMKGGHSVTVVLAGSTICSIANHSMNKIVHYRPTVPFRLYRAPASGHWTIIFLTLLVTGIYLALQKHPESDSRGILIGAIAVIGLRWRHLRWGRNEAYNRHTDWRIEQLMKK